MANNESPPITADTLVTITRKAHEANIGETRAYVEDFLRAAYQSGPNAVFEYEHALAVIRKAPQEVVVEITRALGECQSYDYSRRWALIFAAGELRHRAALPLLVTIVKEPLPSEPQPPSHGFSIVGEETILRTTAIDGIGHLARDGDEEAVAALLRALRHPSISMRRAAAQALLSTKGESELRQRIMAYLPPEEHFLLELKPTNVMEVPQVENPERFLSEEARQSSSLKPPSLSEQRGTLQKKRPPRAGQKEGTK
ncbi:MAG: hypothetical protein J5U19_06425 [Candidatus Methanoperedens sp.]|nr:hypothetical protein [Candidatus Methanoperedens sp.]